MYSVEKHVGRLIEARLASPVSLADVESTIRQAHAMVFASPGQIVSCTDITALDLVPPAAVDRLVELFTRDAPKVERGALLVSRSRSTVAIQMDHALRRVGNPNRKIFEDKLALQRWLAEVLSLPEQTRVRTFLTGCAASS